MAIRLTREQFAELVDQAMASLPAQFVERMGNVSVDIRARPGAKLLASMNVPRDVKLLGLYQGVPMTKKSASAPWDWPERIVIFQRNVESVCDSQADIVAQVRRTVLHEVGHHFGLDENDLRDLGYA